MNNNLNKEKIVIPNDAFIAQIRMLLNEGHNIKMTAKGDSMLPFIRSQKDLIELGIAEKIQKGDIVLAKLPEGRYVIHRIIDETNGILTLMGDGNPKGTEYCESSAVIAKITSIDKGSKTINCDSLSFKLKSRVWSIARPVRCILLALYKNNNK